MTLTELFVLLLTGSVVWFWLDSLKAREAGIVAARRACQREGVQLLDETVVGHGLRFARNDHGHVVLRRGFDFEYSVSGDDRYRGTVVIEAEQLCLLLGEDRRGDERVVTQAFSGSFAHSPQARNEFLHAIEDRRR